MCSKVIVHNATYVPNYQNAYIALLHRRTSNFTPMHDDMKLESHERCNCSYCILDCHSHLRRLTTVTCYSHLSESLGYRICQHIAITNYVRILLCSSPGNNNACPFPTCHCLGSTTNRSHVSSTYDLRTGCQLDGHTNVSMDDLPSDPTQQAIQEPVTESESYSMEISRTSSSPNASKVDKI